MKKLMLYIAAFLFTALSSFAQLNNMNPNTGALGQTLTTTITGTGIFIQSGSPSGNLYEIKLQQGGDIIMLFDYWNMWMYPNTIITSSTTVDAQFSIPLTVTPGAYDLWVTVGDITDPLSNQTTYTLPAAFTISPPDGYIEGTLYHDLNENGIKDGGEPGLPNYSVKILPINYILQTDANGDYSFPASNGSYNVTYVNNTGDYLFVTSNDTLSVTVNNNTAAGTDFGLKNALTSITPDFALLLGTTVHTLVSSEPIFTVGPNSYGNVTGFYVASTPGIVVSPTTSVTVIDPYTIEVNIAIPGNVTIADSIDVRVIVSGTYAGYHFMRKKFRVDPPDGYVQGQLYLDQNNNGVKDGGEPGVPNIQVKLMPTNMMVVSDASGNYSIPAANGNYAVTVLPSITNYLFVTSLDTLLLNVNGGNSTGNDFGLKGALVSITPSSAYINLTQTHQVVADQPIFIPGGSPQGNINQVQVLSSPPFYVNLNTSVNVIDSFTVQLIITVPGGTTLANNIDIRLYTNAGFIGYHYLLQQLDIEPPPNTVSGRLFLDMDQDKVNDASEPGIINGKVKLMPDNSFAFSDFNGDFSIGSFGGVQTLTYENNLANMVLFTDSTSYTFNASGTVTGKDFGFLTVFPDYDLSVTTPYTLRRCNTNQPTTFKVTNISNVTYDAVVWLYHSPNMAYVSSTMPPASMSNDTIYWNISNLSPLGYVNMDATFLLPAAGQTIYITAGAMSLDAGGVVQLTDASGTSFVIACSFDPNDKEVTPPGIFTENFTLMSDTLEYLIRFQNTGNDTAFKVVLLDTLDSDLDYNTFEVLGSSHSVQTELQGNGAVKFEFDNILLPDSNINEPESHGYVRYRILANQGLFDSTEVVNTAHIFFDFNPDVVTNTTLNTLVFVLPVGVGEVISDDEKVIFYPNPLSHSATLLFENPSAEIYTLTLMAITGNNITADQTTNGNTFVIEKNKMPKGIYFYNLTNTVTNKSHSGKFVVE